MPQTKTKTRQTTKLVNSKRSFLSLSRKTHTFAFILAFVLTGVFVLLKTHAASAAGFSVSGNKILDSTGKQVIVHGVDRPSLEWSCTGQPVSGGGSGIPASDISTMRDKWNANAVRIPVSEDRWLPGTANSCAGYQQTVATLVREVEDQGMIAIIDLHWSDQGNSANNSGQQCMPDANSNVFWSQVATLYKSDPNVWFELYNEPFPPGSSQSAQWSTWKNGGTVTCNALVGGKGATWTAPGMQTLANTVRATGANNIIIAGGLSFSSSLAGVPALSGSNIAYAIHIYRQTAGATWGTSGWDYQFGNAAAQVPVVSTEFGDQGCDGSNFDQSLLNYFHSHNTGYTAWAWFSASCNFTSIITDAAGDCYGATSGCVIQADMKAFGTSTPVPTITSTPVPTPTPTVVLPTPSPRPTVTLPPNPSPTPTYSPTPTPTPRPTPTPVSTPTPKPTSSPTPNKTYTGTILGLGGKCLDNWHSGISNGNKIDLFQCNSTGAQRWTVPAGTGSIVNSNGYCLDIARGGVSSGTLVQLYSCNGTAAQVWTIDRLNNTIVNPRSGLCLDDKYSGQNNGNQIWVYTCNGTDAQKWIAPGA